jgi:hypothetical protein
MSHFATIKTTMRNAQAIVAALAEIGYTAQVHDKPENLRSIFQGDSLLQAHIVVKRENISRYSNKQLSDMAKTVKPEAIERYRTSTIGVDVGLQLQPDGSYSWVSDDMYHSVREMKDGLPHLYAKHVILEQAKQSLGDVTVTEKLDAQGNSAGWTVKVETFEQEYAGIDNTFNSASLLITN